MRSVYAPKVPFIDWTQLLFSFFGILLLYIGVLNGVRNKVINLLAILGIIILQSTIIAFFIKIPPIPQSVLNVGQSVLWIAVIYLFYDVANKHHNTIEGAKYIAFLIPIYTYVFFKVRMSLFLNPENIASVSTAYFPLFLLPFALLVNRSYLKWTLVLIVFVSILLSSKRAGFLAFFLSIFVYLYYHIKNKSSKSKTIVILSSIIVIVVLFSFMLYFVETNELSIFQRLSNLSEDGGSGRDVVYLHTWQMIRESDLFSLIFGHGFNTVYYNSSLELSAHTDVLEVIYDYGIIGSILYVVFVYKIFSYYKAIRTYTPQYAPAYASSLVMFTILSLFAHLVIYPTHFLFVCAFWGMTMGNCERIKRKQSCVIKLV